MAKHKRPRKLKIQNRAADSSRRSPEPVWTDLEQTFFASAPPDEPEAPSEPEQFDDLLPPTSSGHQLSELARRLVAALSAPRLDFRVVTIAIASVMLLIGLSAAVFASHH